MSAVAAGRPTDCTPELTEQVATAVGLGMTDKDAASLVGISIGSFGGWQRRARAELANREKGAEPNEREEPFLAFFAAVTRAHLEGQRRNAERIEWAGTPHDEVTRTVRKEARRDKDGKVIRGNDDLPVMDIVVNQTVVREGVFDWKANLEVLRRRHRSEWGDTNRIELTGADGGPLELSVEERTEALVERVKEHQARCAKKPARAKKTPENA